MHPGVHSCAHAPIHRCTHAPDMHTCLHAHMGPWPYTHAPMQPCTHIAPMHAHMLTCTLHQCTHALTRAPVRPCPHTPVHTHVLTDTHTHAPCHAPKRPCTKPPTRRGPFKFCNCLRANVDGASNPHSGPSDRKDFLYFASSELRVCECGNRATNLRVRPALCESENAACELRVCECGQ